MALAAKFFVFISFAAVYVFSTELFPTVIRWDGGQTRKLYAFFSSWVWMVKTMRNRYYGRRAFDSFLLSWKQRFSKTHLSWTVTCLMILYWSSIYSLQPDQPFMFCSLFRNVGMGTSTSVARLGSFASPYVVHLVREIIDRLFIYFFP